MTFHPLFAVVLLLAQVPADDAPLPGLLHVKLRPGRDATALDDADILGARPALPTPRGRDRVGVARLLTLDVRPGSEQALLARLAASSSVEWAERAVRARALASLVPDDPGFPAQWQHDQANDVDMDLPEAWAARGSFAPDAELLLGVVDAGIDPGTVDPDLAGLLHANPAEIPNGLDDDGNGFVDDVFGYDFVVDEPDPDGGHPHGHWVSSVVAARADNGVGLAGVASGLRMRHARAFDDQGFFPASGPYAGKAAAAAAIVYLTDSGVHLINNSWTEGAFGSQLVIDAIDYALDNGVHMVFAAGNDGFSGAKPVNHPGVLAVAALRADGGKWPNSNFGTWVDLSVGGAEVPALAPSGDLVSLSGTSLAAPSVAGLAALVLSEDRDLSVTDLRLLLVESGGDVDALNPLFAGQLGRHANARAALALLDAHDDLGLATPGAFVPALNTWGGTAAGDRLTLSLSGAAPSAVTARVIGLARVDAGLFGGLLVPSPDFLAFSSTDANGAQLRRLPLSEDLPSGASVWLQTLVQDAGAPGGWAFSNGVRITAN